MGKHTEWARERSDFLTLTPGESVQVKWTGESYPGVNNFGGDCYYVVVETPWGKKKFPITAGGVISQFDNYQAGDELTITRSEKDDKNKTKTTIVRVGDEVDE